jgi:hypothetical protein
MERSLRIALARLARRLEQRLMELRRRGRTARLDAIGGLAIEPGDAEGLLAELARDDDATPGFAEPLSAGVAMFDHAARCFQLSPYERDLLLLALAPEVDARFCRLFGFLNDSVVALRPTVGLAISVLAPEASDALAAFLPDRRLAKLGLLTTDGDAPLAGRSMRLAPDLWPRLAGLHPTKKQTVTGRVTGLSETNRRGVSASVSEIRNGSRPLILVSGERGDLILRAIAAELGTHTSLDLAAEGGLWRAVVRDAMWESAPILVDAAVETDKLLELARDCEPAIVAAVHESQLAALLHRTQRHVIEIPTTPLDQDERADVWRSHDFDKYGADVDALASRYRFSPEGIAAVMTLAKARAVARGADAPDPTDVVGACRALGGAGATKLARKLETTFGPDDLVVPHATRTELALFETAARNGHALFGPGKRGGEIRGAGGFIAMFAGPPGTGKTMAAQIVARRLDIDLLRIDLSQVVDKYIGETEKRLESVFAEAEASGALLFFDEADALFGKRTEVKDAHDRYSNIETAYLLQRLEQHPGVAVLATNLAHNLDAAFLRRLHFVIEFPLPGLAERRAIWERHLIAQSLANDVDINFLARFELAGGDIRNAAVAAVLLSSGDDSVAMRHLVIATSRELRKAGRLAQPDLFGAWQDAVLQHVRGDQLTSRGARRPS